MGGDCAFYGCATGGQVKLSVFFAEDMEEFCHPPVRYQLVLHPPDS